MNRKLNYIFLIICMIGLNSFRCSKKETEFCHRINFINKSNEAIYVYGPAIYPDTLGYSHYGPAAMVANAYIYKLEPNASSKYIFEACVEYKFSGVGNPNGNPIVISVVDGDYLEANLEYKLLKQYILTLEDLRRMNWIVIYDPANP